VSEGDLDAAGKVLELRGTCLDPVSGKEKAVREVRRIVDEKKQILEMYATGPDGREVKQLEVTLMKK
jgi:hypothetical protein